jgi:hypothetical protein
MCLSKTTLDATAWYPTTTKSTTKLLFIDFFTLFLALLGLSYALLNLPYLFLAFLTIFLAFLTLFSGS